MTAKLKPQSTVTMHIERGPVSPAQRQAWQRFWRKLTTEVDPTKEKPDVDAPGMESHSQDD